MKYHKQRNRRHEPENKRQGDCLRVAIACIMDFEIEEVPAFSRGLYPGYLESRYELFRRVEYWLNLQNKSFWRFRVYAKNLEDVCKIVNEMNPHMETRYLIFGQTKWGFTHVVCGRKDQVEWNGNSRGIIEKPLKPEEEFYVVGIIGSKL